MTKPNPDKKTVLACIELEGSQHTIEVAKQLAEALGAEVVLCHVVFPPVNAYPDLTPALFARLTEDVEDASRKALAGIAAREGGLRAILRLGEPAAQVLAAIEAEKPAFAVLGTHGRRGIGRLLLGSVAERVLRQSPVPVVTVRPLARERAHAA